jgi:PKHD-type hydroxylase
LFDVPDAFSAAECSAIIALTEGRPGRAAGVTGDGGEGEGIATALRRATTVLLERDHDSAWLFRRLDALFARASVAMDLPVEPIAEPVQVVRYGTGDHFQQWHSDAGLDRVRQRRLSASVELSEPQDYEGGLLEIAQLRMGHAQPPHQGHATIFPSRALHRVVPVTLGVRFALVAWTGLDSA